MEFVDFVLAKLLFLQIKAANEAASVSPVLIGFADEVKLVELR